MFPHQAHRTLTTSGENLFDLLDVRLAATEQRMKESDHKAQRLEATLLQLAAAGNAKRGK